MKEIINNELSSNIDENLNYIKELLKDNMDVVYRSFYCGEFKAAIIYIDGMTDKILLDDYALESLMLYKNDIKNVEDIKDNLLTVTDVKEEEKLEIALRFLLAGDSLMLLDGIKKAYILGTRAWQARGVSEPSAETVIRGSRDGFVETIRFNTVLLRRRVRDTRLRLEMQNVGVRSKTDIAIAYIDDIVNKEVLEDVKNRIKKITIDAVLDSGYVEQLIEDNKWSIFPQIQSTERPDVAAAAIYEGRIAIMVDNSPFCILVPATLPMLFQSPDDYYQRWIYSSIMRFIRFFGTILSLILPALYVAVTSFSTTILPNRLTYSIAATREGIPFPAYLEAIIMEISLAILVESVIRLPKALGSTVGIVGGLIIGQAAVSAGIVSPVMIIIVSITAITTFMTPNYEVVASLRIIRIALIIASTVIGLYGIALVLIIVLIHVIRLESFGVPYLSPFVNVHKKDLKDSFVRSPIDQFIRRPEFIKPGDKVRQKP
ncbi:spore germination protein [Clostridium sp. 19966]|uniref:spore germination protein n=1 Tax=Clostridium sp. 19966 TaxID=2768166 RepID=UPI0028DF417F|nr:spore germination protein [Clostridium sp. 19966]MDT8715614.1 spore germination protein [Clostridium sp. 19966]